MGRRAVLHLLAAVVAFADLKALGAGVALCRALRSASERLSPRLEYSLLVERFNYMGGYPLLSVAAPPIGTVSPRDFVLAWALQHGFGTSFNLGREGHLDAQIELPWFHVFWNFPLGDGWDQERDAHQGHPSTVNANFYMGHEGRENRELSLSEACVVFERLVAWSD